MTKQYEPTPADYQRVKEFMTTELSQMSDKREKIVRAIKPPRFNKEKGTIMFDLDSRIIDIMSDMAEYARLHGYELKKEFHFTIVGFQVGSKIKQELNRLAGSEKENKYNEIVNLINSTKWSLGTSSDLYEISKEYNMPGRPQETEKREAIVQLVDLHPVKEFCEKLSQILGKEIQPQFQHLTLFTKSTHKQSGQMGIGINTEEDFNKCSPKKIELNK